MSAQASVVAPPQSVAEQQAPLEIPQSLAARYDAVRRFSGHLCEPLETEDFVLQSMPDASPTRWHLAHTTWFFETFVLERFLPGYRPFHPDFKVLFNSYYNLVGDQFPRPQRGLLSRPTVREVLAYRRHVDDNMQRLLGGDAPDPELAAVVDIGLHHEQQHQELILTDLKHAFSHNPLLPVYRQQPHEPPADAPPLKWLPRAAGLHEIGHAGPGFSYDNERPRHRVFVEPFAIGARLVTCGEYMHFIDEGGYRTPALWLSDGWAAVQQHGWRAPLYWHDRDGQWWHYTLAGARPVNPAEPVCHVSYFEADAFARWAGARLPTEAEWEIAAGDAAVAGNFVETGRFHPAACDTGGDGSSEAAQPAQMFGDVWEWTASAYCAYPGYTPPPGALGEYNGKFMCNQFVLRGGSCATSVSHIRRTYRNFFPPAARWQFTGIRLGKSHV